jgi:hypothetical protein
MTYDPELHIADTSTLLDDDQPVMTANLADLIRDALDAYFVEHHNGGSDSPDFVHISGGCTPQSRGTTINLLTLTDAVLKVVAP